MRWLFIICFFSLGDNVSFLTFNKGDLILLEEDSSGESVMSANWCVGRCERTGEKGDFPAETVYVLPAVTKPPVDILVSGQTFGATVIFKVKTCHHRLRH